MDKLEDIKHRLGDEYCRWGNEAKDEDFEWLVAEVERLRGALDNIASGELGINVAIKHARETLR